MIRKKILSLKASEKDKPIKGKISLRLKIKLNN